MHCPKCGTEAAGAPKFCRVCGQNLSTVSALLSGQTVIDLWKRRSMIGGLSVVIGGAALGSVLKVLTKQGISPAGEFTPYLLALSILICFAGFGLMLYSAARARSPYSLPSDPSPESASTAKMKLDLLPEEMTGITDRTTVLFEPEAAEVSVRTTAPQDERLQEE